MLCYHYWIEAALTLMKFSYLLGSNLGEGEFELIRRMLQTLSLMQLLTLSRFFLLKVLNLHLLLLIGVSF